MLTPIKYKISMQRRRHKNIDDTKLEIRQGWDLNPKFLAETGWPVRIIKSALEP
jgi:hypothetical protein